MDTIQALQARREAIVTEFGSMRFIRGTVNEQYLKVAHKGKKEPVLRGPYYMVSRREQGKTVGRRLTGPEEVAQARRDAAEHKRFEQLCQEFEAITERLCTVERQEAALEEALKKGLKSRSSRTRK